MRFQARQYHLRKYWDRYLRVLFHCQFPFLSINLDGTIAVETTGKESLREVIEQEMLDGALDGPCSKVGVIAFVCQKVDGLIGNL